MVRLTLPWKLRPLAWRSKPALAGFVLALLAALVVGWWWRERPVPPDEAARIAQLARDTDSPAVWRLYEDAARHGLTAADARRIVEAAKAAEPPYGLIRGNPRETPNPGP